MDDALDVRFAGSEEGFFGPIVAPAGDVEERVVASAFIPIAAHGLNGFHAVDAPVSSVLNGFALFERYERKVRAEGRYIAAQ